MTKDFIRQLTLRSVALGVRKGESAADFAKRDPKAAARLSAFISENKSGLVKAVAGRMS